eukprot:472083_1
MAMVELQPKSKKRVQYKNMDECLNIDDSERQTTNNIDEESGDQIVDIINSRNININHGNGISNELFAAYDDSYRIHICHKLQFRLLLMMMITFIAYKLWFIVYSESNIVAEYKYIASDTTLMPAIKLQTRYLDPSAGFIYNVSIWPFHDDGNTFIPANILKTTIAYNDSVYVNEDEINRKEWNVIEWNYELDNDTFLPIDSVSIIPPKNYGIQSDGFVHLQITHGISIELLNEYFGIDIDYEEYEHDINESWKILAEEYFSKERHFGIRWIPLDSEYFFKTDKSKRSPIMSFAFGGTFNTIYYDLIEQIDETAIFKKNEKEPLRIFTSSNTASTNRGSISLIEDCKINNISIYTSMHNQSEHAMSGCLIYSTVLSISPNPTSQGMNARIVIKHNIEIKELPEIIGGFFHILERCLEAYVFLPLLFGTLCGIKLCKKCGFNGYAPNESLSDNEKHKILLFLQELQIINSKTSQINMEKSKSIFQKKPKGI